MKEIMPSYRVKSLFVVYEKKCVHVLIVWIGVVFNLGISFYEESKYLSFGSDTFTKAKLVLVDSIN